MEPSDILKNAKTVVVIDWPDKEVPRQLALAGLGVVVRSGPGSGDYSAYEVNDGEVVVRHTGRPPERVDIIYAYRPLSELEDIVDFAKALHARAVWTQSGFSAAGVKSLKGCWLPKDELRAALTLIESAGLIHVSEPYIADVARGIQAESR